MKREEIFEKLKTIIVDTLGVYEGVVNEQAKFDEDLGADSLDAVELIMEVEREFGIYVPDEEINPRMGDGISVGQCVDYIENELKSI